MTTLSQFFAQHPRCALAFSGGTDSAWLLYAGLQCGAELRPYYVKSQFQPDFEFRDALRLCEELGVEPAVLTLDALASEAVRANGPERCYHCKTNIMSAVLARAGADGRPGMRALAELGVLSPLRLCGLTKPEIRRLSREAGLFTWDKPAYACLATRIRSGEAITPERLRAVEAGEEWLMRRGYSDLRLRCRGRDALLQLPAAQLARAERELPAIRAALGAYFDQIDIDPEGRRTAL